MRKNKEWWSGRCQSVWWGRHGGTRLWSGMLWEGYFGYEAKGCLIRIFVNWFWNSDWLGCRSIQSYHWIFITCWLIFVTEYILINDLIWICSESYIHYYINTNLRQSSTLLHPINPLEYLFSPVLMFMHLVKDMMYLYLDLVVAINGYY